MAKSTITPDVHTAEHPISLRELVLRYYEACALCEARPEEADEIAEQGAEFSHQILTFRCTTFAEANAKLRFMIEDGWGSFGEEFEAEVLASTMEEIA